MQSISSTGPGSTQSRFTTLSHSSQLSIMPQLHSQAFACLRRQFQPTCRPFTASTPLARSISYKANPRTTRSTDPKAADKIPPSKRPLAREPLPPPTITAESLAAAPYIVRRTGFAQLPVYRKWMSGGTRQVVLVKKVNGSRAKLVDELKEALKVPTDKIRVSPTTGHIELTVSS